MSITLKLPDACDIFQNGYQNEIFQSSGANWRTTMRAAYFRCTSRAIWAAIRKFTNLKIFTVYAMSTQHSRNAVWRYASTSEFPRFSIKGVESHVDVELTSCQRKG
ncbi:hypothetical protein BCON_0241g00060 [Botryotinia convoluta]|uniref:Uncharacterized protein n=1 Tax=Botryotinia convoluta TaxID=54673 RepID=A0A4Z1HIJ4_9HELO|nr:hypothetical protein BCON_0241g00060 [Botryotinia convoluta]